MDSIATRGVIAAAAAAALAVPALAFAPASDAARDPSRADALQRAVTLDGTLRHLRALQRIADVNGGNRVAGSTGHSASAGYVAGQLTAAGYDVTYQPFEFPFFTENSPATLARVEPSPKTYAPRDDFVTMVFSGSGDVTARVQGVDLTLPPAPQPSSTSGCEAADFAGFTPGNIALIQRGTCTFEEKVNNALNAGAVGVIVFNEGQPGRTDAFGARMDSAKTIPVLSVSFAVGNELNARGTRVRMATDTTNSRRTTYNVFAETKGGRADNVVMSGAHLDSVDAGPGINDNGSGSAAQLEVAVQFARVVKEPRNKVRFAWWSAEEGGLLGSTHYVENATTADLGDIALILNFDMVASPNFARFVYDGDDSDKVGAGPGPAGSAAIEKVLNDFYAARNLPTEGTDFSGRSDYGPFLEAGIPAGGIFSGAEGVKTAAQAAKWGGTAGTAYDRCYHQACDTSRNINNAALDQNADAVAYAVATLANSTSDVNGRARRPGAVDGAAEAWAGPGVYAR